MFVAMEELMTWHEKLEKLDIGQTEIVDTNVQSVYSAIRTHFSSEEETRQFSVRTLKNGSKKGSRFVIRIK